MLALVSSRRYGELTYFVPGSTIRGVFRSHMERMVRSVNPEDPIVCDPFVAPPPPEKVPAEGIRLEPGCGHVLAQSERPYAESCPICRLFGSTEHQGRISFADGVEVDKPTRRIEFSDQIQIDRFTGSVGEGPFRWMLLANATFETKISVLNFELWQLGLLAYLFQDLADGLLQMGMGKNVDRGRIESDPGKAQIKVTYYRGDGALKGLYELFPDAENRYGFVPRGDNNGFPGILRLKGEGALWKTYEPRDTCEFWTVLKPTWNEATRVFSGRTKRYPEV